MVVTPPPSSVPSRVFPLPGWTGPINTHWGQGITGGSDLMVASSGTQPVVSMVSGKVTFVSSQASASRSGGNAVEIHGIDGLDYYYAHLAQPLKLGVGQPVNAGQMLGFADSTGDAAGGPPHLHIGIGYGIQTGVGAAGGTGKGFDAVAALRGLVGSPTANNPQIVSAPVQASISSGQAAGTITLPPPTNAPASNSLTDRIRWIASLFAAAGLPAAQIPRMVAISLAENRSSNPGAISATNDVGLLQVNIPTWAQKLGLTVEQLKDPLTNVRAAVTILKAQGLGAWSTHNQGLDEPFITPVQQALTGVDIGDVTVGGTAGDAGGSNACSCGTMNVGPFEIPDIGCEIQCALTNTIQQWKDAFTGWWAAWTQAHASNWFFVIGGAILMALGIAALIGGSKQYNAAVGAVSQVGATAAVAA